MFKLNFVLKQHTPIIHFQHEQDGATLRATEVKPKLDRFILIRIGTHINQEVAYKNGTEIAKKNNWLIGKGDRPALNYKIKITTSASELVADLNSQIERKYYDKKDNVRTESFPTFFGLMGEENIESKKFTFYNEITITILTSNQELLNKIKNTIAPFFMDNNFGTRQSKGFGSFYPKDHNIYPILPLKYYFDVNLKNLPKSFYNYKDETPSQKFSENFRLFEIINLFYSTLRSGINQSWGSNPIYCKSLMFMYAKNKLLVQWDKKKIKDVFYKDRLADQKRKYPTGEVLHYNSSQSHLMRDLLGLSTVSKWFAEYRDEISTKSNSDSVDRFNSPIIFKPIEITAGIYRIYFEGNQNAVNSILNQKFKISNRQGKSFDIATPAIFFIDQFLQYAFSINLSKHIILKNGSGFSTDKKLLEDIYNQIRTNAGISLSN